MTDPRAFLLDNLPVGPFRRALVHRYGDPLVHRCGDPPESSAAFRPVPMTGHARAPQRPTKKKPRAPLPASAAAKAERKELNKPNTNPNKSQKMIEFEIKSRTLNIGNRKGQTVYYAQPKTQQHMTVDMLVERVMRETSLSEGDSRCALITFCNVVCDALQMGMSVDLAELGSFRLSVTSKMMDTPEEVTVEDALNTPRIVFYPKRRMRDAANSVVLTIDRSRVTPVGEAGQPGGGGSEEPGEDGGL